MSKRYWHPIVLLAFLLSPQAGLAQGSEPLIVSDRPGVYCGTYTMPAGQFQLETGLSFSHDRNGRVTTTFFATPATFRIGLVDDLELQISTTGFSRVGGDLGKTDGLGSQSVGLKYRVVDADEAGAGPTMAFIFNLELPSGSSEFRPPEAVPSLVFSIEQGLAANWSVSANLGVAVPTDTLTDERLSDVVYALAFSRSLGANSGLFLEIAGNSPQYQDLSSQTLVDGGFAFFPRSDVQLDISLARGLSGSSSDWTLAGGVSWRIN